MNKDNNEIEKALLLEIIVCEIEGELKEDILKFLRNEILIEEDLFEFFANSSVKSILSFLEEYQKRGDISSKIYEIVVKQLAYHAGINGDSFGTKFPDISKEWNWKKNKRSPYGVFPFSNKKVWWLCKKDHEWKTSCNNRSKGKGCPYCSNKKVCIDNCLATLDPKLAKEWHPIKNEDLTPFDVTIGSDKKIWWLCCVCNNQWETRVNKRTKGQGCPKCKSFHGTSFPEQAFYFYLKKIFHNTLNREKKMFNGKFYELDIFIPELNLAIEIDGEHHSLDTRIQRDEEKNKVISKLDIKLIRIRASGLPIIKVFGCHFISRENVTLNNSIRQLLHYIESNYKSNLKSEQAYLLKNLDINVEEDEYKILALYKKSIKDKGIHKTHPHLVNEWHKVKNEDLTPDLFTAGSNVKVWWICEERHEWKTTISHRTNGTDCPYCQGFYLVASKSLFQMNPILSSEWHPEKNGDLSPLDVAVCSNKVVWWLCNNKGHEWQASINNRHTLDRGCPYCYGRLATRENCLLVINPVLASQWHPEKNGELTPTDFKPNSGKIVWWKCSKGHEWEARVQSRNRGNGCPYCSNKKVCIDNCLATLDPKLAKEWHPIKNEDLTPFDVGVGSNKKVWWLCEKGHEWRTSVDKRHNRNQGCSMCRKK
ncbi:zinc-ribbon domain-containing protein [Metabacillus fastidiosus]|uniref:zinc-ribbon domain-containing protein n=1 Tax=Metabacillus fastidiosus TaxID=1458 RepID=UPI003D2E9B8D